MCEKSLEVHRVEVHRIPHFHCFVESSMTHRSVEERRTRCQIRQVAATALHHVFFFYYLSLLACFFPWPSPYGKLWDIFRYTARYIHINSLLCFVLDQQYISISLPLELWRYTSLDLLASFIRPVLVIGTPHEKIIMILHKVITTLNAELFSDFYLVYLAWHNMHVMCLLWKKILSDRYSQCSVTV